MSCVDYPKSKITLKTYQKIPSKFILNPLNRGLLLLFNLGFGKTLTSITMIRCLLTKYPGKRVIILTPASLISNFANEIDKVSKDISEDILNRITIETYGKFINKIKKGSLQANNNTILVCDEAQYLIGQGSKRFNYLYDYSEKASKVILLSATPVRNNPEEISNLLSLLNGYKVSKSLIVNINNISDRQKRLNSLYRILKCRIMFYGFGQKDNEEFAQRIDHTVELIMSNEFYERYYMIQQDIRKELPDVFKNTKNLQSFLNGIRRAINIVSADIRSPKIDWVINKVKKDLGMIEGFKGNKKVLIYSNWLDAGVNLVKKELDNIGVKYSEVTGSLTRTQKDNEIKKYNENKTKVIIISSSGSEGLNLKNTRSVIILERAWNESRLEQVIGRAIRLNSHKTLPLEQRKVDVYHLILVKPKSAIKKNDYIKSSDEILNQLSTNKQYKIDDFYTFVKKISMHHDKSCF